MNQIFSRISTRNWLFYVTLMSFLLGALLAANLNTQGSIREQFGLTGASSTRLPWLVAAVKEQRQTNENLKKTVSELRQRNSEYEDELSKRSKQAGTLHTELQDLKFLSGLTPVAGPGVIVTLDDNKTKKVADPDSDMYIIHDYDLRNLLNELLAAGAEAISVNDQRIIARTAIRCVGPTVLINGEAVAAPFTVRAIGNKDTLEGALNIPNGIIDLLRISVKARVERSDNVKVPAFSGPTYVKYAKPVPGKG